MYYCQNQTKGELTFTVVRARLTVLISQNFFTSISNSEKKILHSF